MSASITLMGALSPEYLDKFNAWLDARSLQGAIRLLTEAGDPIAVAQVMLASEAANSAVIRTELLALSNETGIDHIYQSTMVDIHNAGVAVFDMDSTLIKAEVMDELAVDAGIGEQISVITASAMRGEIDFVESFVQRLALLKGLSSDVMDSVYQRIQHMDGISTLMAVLHHYGWHTAILSGGFTYFADRVQADYGMSEVHANVLEIQDGALTGRHLGDIVDGERKKLLLTNIVEAKKSDWSQTIACGDGANDLLMLNHAALGVALHAKPLVREKAPCPMNNLGLDGILYLLGMSSAEIRDVTK
ncbi:MAG: phosphoserine phosphatase SerB [Marinomonas foliarum]|jgi:phosphoserine phosphatase|uniref:Phosphoserine phosphatase n=1 Tax=Marinomonas foliarum TaxID=491950 RepID=A0A368ZL76_9GAMM|nr:phosphoserine phosphatase SerB [Marinomonas foliarum]QRV24786.1 phosphoserine phosphatase SerB [Marinomonas foliarum]RCW95037.1 phosphoserine phosphatase [Marinomonas foliarum]